MRYVFQLLLLLIAFHSIAQERDTAGVDLFDILIGTKKKEQKQQYREEKKVHFALFPAAVNVPGGGRAVITAVNAAFFTGNPQTTNLSNIYLIPYTNFGDRYGLYIRPNIWLPDNTLDLTGDYRIAHFPQSTWGLGGDSPQWDESLIDSDYIRVYQNAVFRISGFWFGGPGYALDYHYNISESSYSGTGHLERYEDTPLTTAVSSGLAANLLFDSRKNAINPIGGAYLLMNWRWNSTGLGSTFTNHALFIDARKYLLLSNVHDHILAFRSYYWTIITGDVPYLHLPATNWAPNFGIASRGFEIGRFRSNAMLYGEAEQRLPLSRNGLFGMVGFINVASASEYRTQQFTYWQVGGGAGIRAKLNKFSNTNLSIDFGFSKDFWSIWINIGEMF
ncbi:MAG: hypothetical protein MUE95_09750 [Cyclobacteriaceae bacterium]|jgi:hypothetical protein|nr:hypothetical protein [Cyclobacteriaceae bacterium]